MKIQKFATGGTYVPPLASYTPVTVSNPGRPTSALSSEDSKQTSADLTDKDLLKMLEHLDGLPSDMQKLTSSLQSFYFDQQFGPSTTSNIASRYLGILAQMKTANFNNKQFEKAYDIVSENGGINEFAINERGQLFCTNGENDFKLIKPEDLKDNEGYIPLTNAELLKLRAYNTDLAFNNTILGVVQNGIGIETVNKYIKDIISGLGATQSTTEGYVSTQQGKLIQGLSDLQSALLKASEQGLYNVSTQDLYKYSLLTKDQKDSANLVLKYIYQTLPQNAKTLLKIKSGGTDKDAIGLISSFISSQLDIDSKETLDLKAGPTQKKATQSSTKDTTELNTSLPLNVVQSIGGYDQPMTIDKGNGVQLSINGTYYQQLKDPDGKPIIDTSMKEMLANTGLQSVIKNTKNITFGDQKVDMDQLGNITYNNTGLIRANLPINSDGSVRLEILDDWEKAESEIKLLGENATTEQIKEIMQNNGLDDLLDSRGMLNINKFGPFMVTEGYTIESNGIKDSDWVKEIDPTDAQMELIKKSLTTGTDKDKTTPEIDTYDGLWNMFDWFGMYDKVYKAAIYIPLNNNQLSAVYGSNQKLDYNEATQLEQKYRNFNKQVKLQSTSADVL